VVPNPKKMGIKINIKKPSTSLCAAPVFNPTALSQFVLENDASDWTISTLKAMESKSIPGLKVNVFSDNNGSWVLFRDNSSLTFTGGVLTTEVPESGKFLVSVEYLSTCNNCTPNTGYGNVALHQWYDNRTESGSYSQTGSQITVNLDMISGSSVKQCGN
jgi:hypothetical protein